VPHGRGLFAVGSKLRPQLDDSGVVAEEATLDENVRNGRGRALACRVGVDRRVRRDRASGCRIGDARDGVDHQLAAPVDGDL
jgi:hypothetical protein